MTGPFLSILLPPIGPAVTHRPALSQTTRLFVAALAFSLPAGTAVTSENDASAALASPDPESVAVQASGTLSACHRPSGAAHEREGAMVSATVSVNVADPLQPPTSSPSAASTVNVNVPVAEVVPDRTPLAESDMPAGKAP